MKYTLPEGIFAWTLIKLGSGDIPVAGVAWLKNIRRQECRRRINYEKAFKRCYMPETPDSPHSHESGNPSKSMLLLSILDPHFHGDEDS